MGPSWVAFRLKYEFQRRTGHFTRLAPVKAWTDIPIHSDNEGALRFIRKASIDEWCDKLHELGAASSAVVTEADAILRGVFRLFSRDCNLGFPPDWNKNPFTGDDYSPVLHWSLIREFDHGDIKAVWECSRFSWAFSLGRAYARTEDPRYAEGFWALFEHWLVSNPPNQGPQWKCGQEATFRLFAAAWARRVFADAPGFSPDRRVLWQRFVYATGKRISSNLDYALNQSNNHGISECVGLLTVCALLPSIPEQSSWRARAANALSDQVDQLVYSDGAFSQHSTVYHRVLLHNLSWYVALSAEQAQPSIVAALSRSWRYLLNFTDPATGQAPLSGASDGSNILPLADCGYLDFRPCLQLASVLSEGVRALPHGPWDEAVEWLTANRTSEAVMDAAHGETPSIWTAKEGGWTAMTQSSTRLVFHTRTHYKHRPSHADLLHVHIWWKGHPITLDPGTYSYNAKGPREDFTATRVHNTVEVDGLSQMQHASRFLVLPWPTGCVERASDGVTVIATHDAYSPLGVRHTRSVKPEAKEKWVVTDNLQSVGGGRAHTYRMQWLFRDCDYTFEPIDNKLVLHLSAGDYVVSWSAGSTAVATLARAEATTDRGWWSPHYLQLDPALSLAVQIVSNAPDVSFTTYLGPAPANGELR